MVLRRTCGRIWRVLPSWYYLLIGRAALAYFSKVERPADHYWPLMFPVAGLS
jgi:hypothetical protein